MLKHFNIHGGSNIGLIKDPKIYRCLVLQKKEHE